MNPKMPPDRRNFVVLGILILCWNILIFAVYGMVHFWVVYLAGPFRAFCAWIDSAGPLISVVTIIAGVVLLVIVMVKCEEV